MSFKVDIAGAQRVVVAAMRAAGIVETQPIDGPRTLGLDDGPLDVDWVGKSAPQPSMVELTSNVQAALAAVRVPPASQPHLVGNGWQQLEPGAFMLYVYVGEDDMTEPEQPAMLDLFILLVAEHFDDGAALARIEGRMQSLADLVDDA